MSGFCNAIDVCLPRIRSYLGVYSLIMIVDVAFFLTGSVVDAIGRIKASRSIHEKLIVSIFGSTFR